MVTRREPKDSVDQDSCCNGNAEDLLLGAAAVCKSSGQVKFKKIFSRQIAHFTTDGLVQQTVQIVVRSLHHLTLFIMRCTRMGFHRTHPVAALLVGFLSPE